MTTPNPSVAHILVTSVRAVLTCHKLGALPLPVWGEGWGEGVRDLSIDLNPSPHPSPYGRGGRPSLLLRRAPLQRSARNLQHFTPFPISSTSLAGVIGVCAMRTPNGCNASSMAEITAAAVGMVPTSPAPLAPSGLSGDGVSL